MKYLQCLKLMEHDKLEKLIQKARSTISDKTDHEKRVFYQINSIPNFVKNKSTNVCTYLSMEIVHLKSLVSHFNGINIDHSVIRGMKFSANKIIENIPFQIVSKS